MFHSLGAEIVDADEAAHNSYVPGSPGFDQVVAAFGQEFVRAGRIDRARLGDLVFSDEGARHRLNAIVHPLVRKWMAARTAEAAARGSEIVIHDVPLLYESELESVYPEVVLVYAPEALMLKRLVDERGVVVGRARAIIASQLPIEEKRGRAAHVVDNSADLPATRGQVERLWEELRGEPRSLPES
jgi:dephospho-CoA kinase